LLALAHLARVKHVQFKDGPVDDFTNLLHREIIKRGQDCILHHLGQAVKLVARLLLALF